jgi:hypothetical protein
MRISVTLLKDLIWKVVSLKKKVMTQIVKEIMLIIVEWLWLWVLLLFSMSVLLLLSLWMGLNLKMMVDKKKCVLKWMMLL